MTTHDMIVWAPLFRQTRGSKLTNLDSGSINQPTNRGMTGMSLNHLGSLSPVTFIFLGWVQVSHRIRFYWVTMPDRMYTWYLLIDMWVVGASQWVTAILVFIAIRLLVDYTAISSLPRDGLIYPKTARQTQWACKKMLNLLTKVELPCMYVVVSQNTYPKKRQQPYVWKHSPKNVSSMDQTKTRLQLQYILYAYILDISQDAHLWIQWEHPRPRWWKRRVGEAPSGDLKGFFHYPICMSWTVWAVVLANCLLWIIRKLSCLIFRVQLWSWFSWFSCINK